MLLPVKAICDQRTRIGGTNPINIQYCYSSEKRTVLPTGISIPQFYWNRKKRCISDKLPREWGDPKQLNEDIFQMLRRTEDIIRLAHLYKVDSIQLLKDYFPTSLGLKEIEAGLKKKAEENKMVSVNLDFFFQVDDYIKSQTSKVSEFMPAIYRNMKMHLQEFEKFRQSPITFECLNYDF